MARDKRQAASEAGGTSLLHPLKSECSVFARRWTSRVDDIRSSKQVFEGPPFRRLRERARLITVQPVFRTGRQIEIARDDNGGGSADRPRELVQHRPSLSGRIPRQIHVMRGHAAMPDLVPAFAVFDDLRTGALLRDPTGDQRRAYQSVSGNQRPILLARLEWFLRKKEIRHDRAQPPLNTRSGVRITEALVEVGGNHPHGTSSITRELPRGAESA